MAHKLKYRTFCFNIRRTLFTVRVGKHWSRLPRSVVEVHAGILAGFQKLTGQGPEQPAVIDPALSRVVGLDHLQSFLPTLAVL